jgi:hypothetical protein
MRDATPLPPEIGGKGYYQFGVFPGDSREMDCGIKYELRCICVQLRTVFHVMREQLPDRSNPST